MRFVDAGRTATVLGWFDALDRPPSPADPAAEVTAAWMAGLSGDEAALAEHVEALKDSWAYGPLPDGARSVESAVAMMQGLFGFEGPVEMATAPIPRPFTASSVPTPVPRQCEAPANASCSDTSQTSFFRLERCVAIESLNARYRRSVEARGHFPTANRSRVTSHGVGVSGWCDGTEVCAGGPPVLPCARNGFRGDPPRLRGAPRSAPL